MYVTLCILMHACVCIYMYCVYVCMCMCVVVTVLINDCIIIINDCMIIYNLWSPLNVHGTGVNGSAECIIYSSSAAIQVELLIIITQSVFTLPCLSSLLLCHMININMSHDEHVSF